MGLSARTQKEGALLERWRAQCGTTPPLYSKARVEVFAARTRATCILRAPYRFPEPCEPSRPSQPSPKHVSRRANEGRRLEGLDILRSTHAGGLSRVSVAGDRHEGQESGRRQLLALHHLRGSLVRVPDCAGPKVLPVAMRSSGIVRRLHEVIAALDRRAPQVHRAGEASIARDAAALRARALDRIEQLESERLDDEGV